jgi:hypothetical protein
MSRILGLDIGTNSIGWAIIDDSSNKIIDCGVRIFPNSLTKKRRLARKKRIKENKFVQLNLVFTQLYLFLKHTNPIVLTLIFGSFITALLTILNFSNWQFWLNPFLTILIATLNLLHTNNKK